MIVIDGIRYGRVYVCELEPGMVNAFGETVESIQRITDDRTWVMFTNGQINVYARAEATMLIELSTIPNDEWMY